MLKIRRVEEALANKYADQKMRCPMHLCIGQEAISSGVCDELSPRDMIYSNHRAHGHYLAKGGNLDAMIAELYGKSTGCCGGRGGSMHLIDKSVNFMGSTPIVGGTIPLAVGSAWASKLKADSKITVVFFGDGCFEEGVMHESLNFASLHKLPIIFICENNNFSVYTKLENRQPKRSIHKLAKAHGLKTDFGDGNDVIKVKELTKKAIKSLKKNNGPYFLEFMTYRHLEHCGPFNDDHLNYRSKKEIQNGLNNCPLKKYEKKYLKKNKQTIEKFEIKIQKIIDSAFIFASKSPNPTFKDSQKKLYSK